MEIKKMKIKEATFKETGEFRIPKKGEYYFCFAGVLKCDTDDSQYEAKIATRYTYGESDWRPTGGEQFYTIDIKVRKNRHDNTKDDFDRINTGNCFINEKEANEMVHKLEIRLMKGLEG